MNAQGSGCVKGLLWFLGIWAGASTALFGLFQLRYEPEGARNAALAAGAFVTLFSGFFTRGFTQARTAMNSDRDVDSQSGIRTVTGLIVPTGHAKLLSPASGTDCAAYAYETFTHEEEGGRRTWFRGFAMVPSEIRGPSGTVRLLGMPFSDEFKELGDVEELTFTNQSRAFEKLKSYLETAAITRHELSLDAFKKAFHGMLDVLTDTDGTMRKDSAAPGSDPTLRNQTITERLVPVGAEVTVTGLYAAERGGLVNDPDWTSSRRLQLFLGNRKATASTLWKRAVGDFITGLILVSIVVGIAIAVLESERRREVNLKSRVPRTSGPKTSMFVSEGTGADTA
ncbi:MAG: hypothetical protein ABIT01_14875 [Thermoanaerobaculia bacterium]